mmetsp:Transcript_65835/g.109423  ORF Transcript_65835/g.109423 Transcript_65835/m.109423 type:complete len:289 (+) Transcript_65835:20-886(+)
MLFSVQLVAICAFQLQLCQRCFTHRHRLTQPRSASFEDFSVLEAEISSYLSTLNRSALEDPSAPSPLAYLELRRNGRADIAEGCMIHGGYVRVSEQLGVPVRLATPKEKTRPPRFLQIEDERGAIALSRFSKEARLSKSANESALSTSTSRERNFDATVEPRPFVAGTVNGPTVVKHVEAEWSLARFVQLNGVQRISVMMLVCTLAAGFGKSSTQVLDGSTVAALQSGSLALLLAHTLIAAYGTTLVSRSSGTAFNKPIGPAPLWFVKLLLTGAGGLQEVRRQLDEKN